MTDVVTTLTVKRGSDGMGLPEAMSQKTIDTIVATAGLVAHQALDITSHFYKHVLQKYPSLLAFFNPAHNVPISLHQPKALAGSVVAYASNIQDLSPLLVPGGAVAAICHRHCALTIYPESYVVVHDNLMASVGAVLGTVVTPDIAAAWSEAVLFLAKAFIDTEESLYKMAEQRSGGWSGLIEFEVSKIVEVADGIKSISFKPPAGSKLEGKSFEFTPGQYLSVKIDPENDGLTAPRHYTVTSPPGADFLQCTVKKIQGGKVSTYIHEQLRVGDKVKLTAPFGVFTADPDEVESAVLLSAGIGCTPMVNFKKSLADKVKLTVHVDSKPEAYAYRELFADSGDLLEKFTRTPDGKRPTSEELVSEIIDKVGTKNNFYICGPEKWMDEIQAELVKRGADKVMCEVFGSQLATGCPFMASGCPFKPESS